MKQKKPFLVFLIETKLQRVRMESIRRKLEFSNILTVDSVGKSGGLALLWGDAMLVEIQNYSQRYINGIVWCSKREEPWKFTGFYGQRDVTKRHEAWVLLKHLASFAPHPWVCIGDFNEIEIVVQSKKWGDR
jgi:hypothetical protein